MIAIERATEVDLAHLLEWVAGERELCQWSAHFFPYPLTLAALVNNLKTPDTVAFKAVDTSTQQMVGYAEIARIHKKNGTATLSRVIVPKNLRGRGIAPQMLRKICAYAFTELELRRIDLFVFDFNRTAIRVYESLGFKQEGCLREWFHFGPEENWDNVYMGLLKREFRADDA